MYHGITDDVDDTVKFENSYDPTCAWMELESSVLKTSGISSVFISSTEAFARMTSSLSRMYTVAWKIQGPVLISQVFKNNVNKEVVVSTL